MIRKLSFLFLLALLLAAPLFAQSATIAGKVTNAEGGAVADATVTLLELRRSVRVGSDGSYRFENITPGHYHVQAESRRLGTVLGEADLTHGASQVIDLVLDPAVHSEEIVVTASPDSRRESEVYQPVNVVDDREIAALLQPTIGETLNSEPGVSSTYFGPGASRPVIRGLGADRVRMLEDGVGTGDASNVSPDHAVSVDPAGAQQIEILRGPATLLYGSNAVGGVVNVISERIPDSVPAQPITGTVNLRTGTVAGEKSGSFNLTGGQGAFAWHADASLRDTDDLETPEGTLENSSLEARSGTIGGSWVGERGYLGGSFNAFDTNYGIPGEEEAVRIDMEQRRFDVKGELRELGIFRNARIRIGRNDYEHVELEGDEIGTRFTNEATEGRLEATHRAIGRMTGSIGLQWSNSDFAAIGDEAFIPPNEAASRAVFAFEEVTNGKWDFQFGARYESQDVTTDVEDLLDRSFDGLSGSVGAIYKANGSWAIATSIARAVRLPTATELYADGVHAATGQYEIGDVSLTEETSVGIDLSIRKIAGRFRGELNFFNNSFDGYIFDTPTGEEEEEVPVFRFVQRDARFRGVELDTHTELWHDDANHLELEVGADYVRAKLDRGGNLPRIPPMRASIGLRWQGSAFSASGEVRRYSRQDEVTEFETETAGYTMVNATAGYRFFVGNSAHDILLRGTNLTDELARNHVSPLKDLVPMPGRDFTLSYRVVF